jgi:hypothetical protein
MLLLLVSFGFSLLYTLTVPLISNFSVFFPSFLFVLSSLVQTSLHPPLPVLALWVFIGQKGAGASLLPPYGSAWGAGLCCPATAPGWLANERGWQGAAPSVYHHERVWGFVDREGCFGCREKMAERREWPRGELVLGVLSFSFKN